LGSQFSRDSVGSGLLGDALINQVCEDLETRLYACEDVSCANALRQAKKDLSQVSSAFCPWWALYPEKGTREASERIEAFLCQLMYDGHDSDSSSSRRASAVVGHSHFLRDMIKHHSTDFFRLSKPEAYSRLTTKVVPNCSVVRLIIDTAAFQSRPDNLNNVYNCIVDAELIFTP
jgi:hypothetical protein